MKQTLSSLLCAFLLLCGYNMSAQCTYTSSGPVLPWPDNCTQCTAINGIPNSVVICAGGSYTATPVVGSNATGWSMTGPGTISPSSGPIPPPVPPIVITPPAGAGSYVYTFSASGWAPNILVDGDFELMGPQAFCSDYTQQLPIPGMLSPDWYGIVTSGPDVWTPTGCTYPAADLPQNGSHFLISSATANMNILWEEKVEVCPGQLYQFNGYIEDLSFPCPGFPFNPPSVTVTITDGTTTVSLTPTLGATWTPMALTWPGTTATMVDIKIAGMNPGITTMGLDNLSFQRKCISTQKLVIRTVPLSLSGPTTACAGDIVTMSSTVPGGTWSGSSPVATIDPSTGTVVTYTAGVVTFTYTAPGGCTGTITLTVNPTPTPITGPTDICLGSTVAMSSTPGGGVWILTPGTGNGTITPGGGMLTGTAVGNVTITYKLPPGGCFTTTTVNIWPNPVPPTVPPFVMCAGSSYLINSNPVGGTWVSSNTSVATVTSGMPSTLTGVGVGTSVISYTTFPSCTATAIVTVQNCPGTGGGTISMCAKSAITLSEPVPGGSWGTSGPIPAGAGISPIPGGCVVNSGTTAGTMVVTYTSGAFTWTWTITITPMPTACVWSFWDPSISDYQWEFIGTAGATVTYCVEDYMGNPLGSLTVTIPTSGVVDVPYSVVAAATSPAAFRVCICGVVDPNGCPGVCGCPAPGAWPGCCAHVNPAGPKAGNTTAAGVDATLHMNIAPNPTQHQLTISAAANDKHNETLEIEITDMMGKVIMTTTANMTDGEMATAVTLPDGIANGIYLVKVSGSVSKAVTKFVVNK